MNAISIIAAMAVSLILLTVSLDFLFIYLASRRGKRLRNSIRVFDCFSTLLEEEDGCMVYAVKRGVHVFKAKVRKGYSLKRGADNNFYEVRNDKWAKGSPLKLEYLDWGKYPNTNRIMWNTYNGKWSTVYPPYSLSMSLTKGIYRLCITRYGESISKEFKTFEDAHAEAWNIVKLNLK